MPKLAAKVIGRRIKDYGKGKDAEAREVYVATLRIDGRAGLPSTKLEIHLTDEEVEAGDYQLGDKVILNLDVPQQNLDINKRAVDRRSRAATSN